MQPPSAPGCSRAAPQLSAAARKYSSVQERSATVQSCTSAQPNSITTQHSRKVLQRSAAEQQRSATAYYYCSTQPPITDTQCYSAVQPRSATDINGGHSYSALQPRKAKHFLIRSIIACHVMFRSRPGLRKDRARTCGVAKRRRARGSVQDSTLWRPVCFRFYSIASPQLELCTWLQLPWHFDCPHIFGQAFLAPPLTVLSFNGQLGIATALQHCLRTWPGARKG